MTTKENINTKKYWDNRFAGTEANSWKNKKGEDQTMDFAYAIAKRLRISKNFSGTILDFGCALGDAIPVYKRYYPQASFSGVDFSSAAIEQCREKFGNMATFICGNVDAVPNVDIIITSNVLEHLSNDKNIAKKLLDKCKDLYIAVPYNEKISDEGEHINSYNIQSFDHEYIMGVGVNYQIYLCRGYNLKRILRSYYNIELKNLLRPFFGKPKSIGGVMQQILFHITNN
jgi:2-polyprenyl-3-methyl-5-hydroxy-6-metoxy-1,4-benzoquinol methylase